MENIEEFNQRLKTFETAKSNHLKNNLSALDLTSKHFLTYFSSIGHFFEKVFTSVPNHIPSKLGGIFTQLYLALANNSNNRKLLNNLFISSFNEVEKLLTSALEINSVKDLYYESYNDIQTLRRQINNIKEEINLSEKEKEREEKRLEELFNRLKLEGNDKLKLDLEKEISDIKETILKNITKEFDDLSNKSKVDATEIENLRKSMQAEVEDIKTRYKDDLTNFELIKQELIFTKAADWNRRASYIWNGILLLLLFVLAIFSFYFIKSCWKDSCDIFTTYSDKPQEYLRTLFYSDLAKNLLIRIFMLSIIILLIKYTMKHINALMHNYTINTHKANSLAAAMRIFASITNDSTREIVIATAAKEIFSQQKTGYLNKEDQKLDWGLLEKLSSIFNKKTTL